MTVRPILLACVLLLAPFAAFAQDASTPTAKELPAWEQLSAQQRELLLAPVRDRWNGSSAKHRRHMLDHAERWQTMTPEERERARHGHNRWKNMPPERQRQARALFEHMRGMPDAERKAMIERWKAMTPEQREAWVEAHPPKDSPKPL